MVVIRGGGDGWKCMWLQYTVYLQYTSRILLFAGT